MTERIERLILAGVPDPDAARLLGLSLRTEPKIIMLAGLAWEP